MSLGSLITVIASGATNLTIVLLDNGIYEVTGGQQTAAALASRHAAVDIAALARAAGFSSVMRFDRLDDWHRRAGSISCRIQGGERCS